jgi:putative transposase
VRYHFIAEHQHEYAITTVCRVLEVSSSGYYAWCQRLPRQHSRDDAHLAQAVQKAFQANRRVYGSPRIHADLKEQGRHCARKRVARLMRELGLTARRPTHRTITTKSEKGAQARGKPAPARLQCRSTQHEMGHGYDLHLDFRGLVVSRNRA